MISQNLLPREPRPGELVPGLGGDRLALDVIAHLGAQIDSAQRLLHHVLRQAEAIRARDVDGVLGRLTDIQIEMDGRSRLELQRTALLTQAGARLGLTPAEITLDRIAELMSDGEAETARGLSAQLRGLLAEIEREHTCNRALMRQELSFLEHLTRMIGREPDTGYAATGRLASSVGMPAAARPTHAFDLRA